MMRPGVILPSAQTSMTLANPMMSHFGPEADYIAASLWLLGSVAAGIVDQLVIMLPEEERRASPSANDEERATGGTQSTTHEQGWTDQKTPR